ncbi:integrase [Sphingomonas vulcanisoli]|uniref:Integrase n=1 Tax=Sphingomonas vulcanisoli TaxID=1658060 RepID=A0ABX0TPB8_9SPHN|nr:integrase arm-type DNA-binding domain-containing protein [Sphingomonas vulcanisoli]NIJ07266.1 integrase [Sphingomonas vulcanisoli]
MLTAARIRAAAPKACAYKVYDTGRLHLHVAPSGRRTWRLAFTFGGREQLLTLGTFPELSLADARDRRDEARRQLRGGEDPRIARKHEDLPSNTFEAIARRWHQAKQASWSPAHAGDVIASLEAHVFPAIGAAELAAITAPAVLELLQRVEAGGAIETARRVRQRISAVFQRAIAEGIAAADPAALVHKALADRPDVRRQAALTELDDVRGAWRAIAAAPAAEISVLAAQFVAMTAVRCGSARGARWDEITGVDWEDPLVMCPAAGWRIPAARMKLKRSRKADTANDHIVPLSAAAVQLLRRARSIAGRSVYVFPRAAGAGAPIGENAILAVHHAAGLAGRHSPHGWRAAFATILNEARPEWRAAIDLALAHAPKDKVEAAYNRATHIALRREIYDEWAHILAATAIEA